MEETFKWRKTEIIPQTDFGAGGKSSERDFEEICERKADGGV